MIPRLTFQEWEGLEYTAERMVQKIEAASSFTPFTLAEVKTVAWLVENNHLDTQLERLVLSSNLDTSSVSAEVETNH